MYVCVLGQGRGAVCCELGAGAPSGEGRGGGKRGEGRTRGHSCTHAWEES